MSETHTLAEQVTQLSALRDSGILSEEEFITAKQKVVSGPPPSLSPSTVTVTVSGEVLDVDDATAKVVQATAIDFPDQEATHAHPAPYVDLYPDVASLASVEITPNGIKIAMPTSGKADFCSHVGGLPSTFDKFRVATILMFLWCGSLIWSIAMVVGLLPLFMDDLIITLVLLAIVALHALVWFMVILPAFYAAFRSHMNKIEIELNTVADTLTYNTVPLPDFPIGVWGWTRFRKLQTERAALHSAVTLSKYGNLRTTKASEIAQLYVDTQTVYYTTSSGGRSSHSRHTKIHTAKAFKIKAVMKSGHDVEIGYCTAHDGKFVEQKLEEALGIVNQPVVGECNDVREYRGKTVIV